MKEKRKLEPIFSPSTPKKKWSPKSKTSSKTARLFGVVKIVLFLLISVLLVYGIFFRSGIFTVRTVECLTQYGSDCPEQADKVLARFVGSNMIFLDEKQLAKNLENSDIMFQSIKVVKNLPGKLSITLTTAKPAVAVALNSSPDTTWYLLDQNGRHISNAASVANLPKIILSSKFWPPDTSDSAKSVVVTSTKILFLLSFEYANISSQVDESGDLYVSLPTGLVIFSSAKDPAESVATLQLVTGDLTIQKSTPKTIDLRFKNPVVAN